MLPKSLHTVRILTAVARSMRPCSDSLAAVLRAAQVLGYPDASAADPLIAKAAAQLAAPATGNPSGAGNSRCGFPQNAGQPS